MGATNIRLISMRIGLDYAKEPKSNIKNAKLITITKNTLTSNYQSQTHEIVGNKKGKKRGGGELKIRYLWSYSDSLKIISPITAIIYNIIQSCDSKNQI